jgi:hypothetical protein
MLHGIAGQVGHADVIVLDEGGALEGDQEASAIPLPTA